MQGGNSLKQLYFISILVLFLLLFTSCHKDEGVADKERVKPVKVITIQEETRPVTLHYTGNTGAGETKRLSFKSPGKISNIPVEKGDNIQPGQLLAQLETRELELGLEASRAQVDTARAQYNKALEGATREEIEKADLELQKARDAYIFARDQHQRMDELYQEGFVSQSEMEQVSLELDIRKAEMDQAELLKDQVNDPVREEDKQALLSQLEKAQKDLEHKKTLLEDASLYSNTRGQVIDVLYREGEVVSAGHPVVIVKNCSQIVNTGISQKDLKKVLPGMDVQVELENKVVQGKITRIAPSPDPYSHTYETEVQLSSEVHFPLGSFVRLRIITGQVTGIWMPANSILPGKNDYVYLVEEDRAIKREVSILEFYNSQVRIKGLEPGDQLVIEGMNNLEEGDAVSLLQLD